MAFAAASHAVTSEVIVIGTRTCRAWLDQAAEDNSELRDIARVWVNGFLSGLAVGAGKDFGGGRDGKKPDSDAVSLWVDEYCRANPSRDLADAAKELFFESTRRK